MKLLQVLIPIFFIIFSSLSFSQEGTYELSDAPSEAFSNFVTSEGVFELPIYIGTETSVIKLKRRKRVVIIRDKGKDSEHVLRGGWDLNGDIVSLKVETLSEMRKYRLVEYESGTYLESMNGKIHYKKR